MESGTMAESSDTRRTAFAALLEDYMWNRRPPHEPPLTPAQLAKRIGVSKQTVSTWLRSAVVPRQFVLRQVAERTGMSYEEVFTAAGYSVPDELRDSRPGDELAQRLAELPAEARARVEWMLNLPPEEWQRIAERMDEFVALAQAARAPAAAPPERPERPEPESEYPKTLAGVR